MERRRWGEWDDPGDRTLTSVEIIEEAKKVGSSCYANFSNLRRRSKSAAAANPSTQPQPTVAGPRALQRRPETSEPLRRHTSLPTLVDTAMSRQNSKSSPRMSPQTSPTSPLSPSSVSSSRGDTPVRRAAARLPRHASWQTADGTARTERLEGGGEADHRRGSKKVLMSLPEGSKPPDVYCVDPSIALPWTPYRRSHSKLSTRKMSKEKEKEPVAHGDPPASPMAATVEEKPASPQSQNSSPEKDKEVASEDQSIKRGSSNALQRRATCPDDKLSLPPKMRKRNSILHALESGTLDTADMLFVMSQDEQIPYHILKVAYELFEEFASPPEDEPKDIVHNYSVHVTQAWRLSIEQFRKLTLRLPGAGGEGEDLHVALPMPFHRQSCTGISFKEFAIWFFSESFAEDIVVTREVRDFRDAARQNGLDVNETERVKEIFDRYATDGRRGSSRRVINHDGFEHLLADLMKRPADQALPATRVKTYWREADKDGNGLIDVMEFIDFYVRNFAAPGSAVSY